MKRLGPKSQFVNSSVQKKRANDGATAKARVSEAAIEISAQQSRSKFPSENFEEWFWQRFSKLKERCRCVHFLRCRYRFHPKFFVRAAVK